MILLPRICGAVALLTFVGGSLLIAIILLGVGTNPKYPSDYLASTMLAIQLMWPLVAIVWWVLCTVALVITRRPIVALVLLPIALVVIVMVQGALNLVVDINGNKDSLQGLPAMLAILLLFTLDVGAILFVSRSIFQ